MDPLTPELVTRALAGHKPAIRELLAALAPVVKARVARALLRHPGRLKGRDIQHDVEDLTQETFLALFADDGSVLRSWDPLRGLSLKNFAGLVAERRVANTLRSLRKSPYAEDPVEDAWDRVGEGGAPDPERSAASRQMFRALLERARGELTPMGMHLFERLIVAEQSTETVCAATGLSRDAVYKWRSRLLRLARRLAAELGGGEAAAPRPAEVRR